MFVSSPSSSRKVERRPSGYKMYDLAYDKMSLEISWPFFQYAVFEV
jgi:hypothetical protein